MGADTLSREGTSLPEDILAKAAADFAHEPSDRILALLEAYKGADRARVIRCVLHLASGDIDRLHHLMGTAQRDSRDVIYWAEYDRGDKRIHDFNQPFQIAPSVHVFEWKSDVGARWLTTRRERDLARLSFDGATQAQNWTPVEVEWILDEPGDARRDTTDSPNLVPGVPVLSARAARALRPHLVNIGELLPLSHKTDEYFALNVTSVVDALDEARSDLTRFGSTGRIMLVRVFAFHQQAVASQTVFKDRRLALSKVFVTDPFVKAVAQARLTGFVFRRVWPSDAQQGAAADAELRRGRV